MAWSDISRKAAITLRSEIDAGQSHGHQCDPAYQRLVISVGRWAIEIHEGFPSG